MQMQADQLALKLPEHHGHNGGKHQPALPSLLTDTLSDNEDHQRQKQQPDYPRCRVKRHAHGMRNHAREQVFSQQLAGHIQQRQSDDGLWHPAWTA